MRKFKVSYHDGNRERKISEEHLRDIRSRVVTHEGEVLTGDKGRKYMDKYAKTYLKKDMEGFYRDTKVR